MKKRRWRQTSAGKLQFRCICTASNDAAFILGSGNAREHRNESNNPTYDPASPLRQRRSVHMSLGRRPMTMHAHKPDSSLRLQRDDVQIVEQNWLARIGGSPDRGFAGG